MFPSKREAIDVLRNKGKLDADTGIYLKNDQTENQRNYIKKLVTELREKEQNGVKDLKIKYFSGIPRIVKSKN